MEADGSQPPPNTNYAAYIIAIILLVFMSAFFSATETSFTSANRARLKLAAEDGKKGAKKALKILGAKKKSTDKVKEKRISGL